MKDKLFLWLRWAICQNTSAQSVTETKEDLPEIYKLAKKYDLGSIIAFGAQKAGITNDVLTREKALSILRVEKLKYTTEQVYSLLEEAKIPHIPLKGSCIRELYPEQWLRTSCDVDIFVAPENIDKAVEVLEKAGFVKIQRHVHDVSFTSPNNCHVELHFALWYDSDTIFSSLWENTVKETEYRCTMNDEYFYFYHMAHMASHIKYGGCGIRPFIDLWLLCHKLPENPKRAELCKKGNLENFEKHARRLSEIWFSGKEFDSVSSELEGYVLSGALYGNAANAAAVHGGKGKYILSRVFMPYSLLKNKYPYLDGKPYLMPVYTVRRWCNLLNPNRAKISAKELKTSTKVSKKDTKRYSKLFKNLGL